MAEGMEHSSHEPWCAHEQQVGAPRKNDRFHIHELPAPPPLPKTKEQIRTDFLDSPVFDENRVDFLEQLLLEKLYNYKEKCFELDDADMLQVLACLHFSEGKSHEKNSDLRPEDQNLDAVSIRSALIPIVGREKAQSLQVGSFFNKQGQGVELWNVTVKKFFDMFDVSSDEIQAMCAASGVDESDLDAISFSLVVTHDAKNPVRGFASYGDPRRIGLNFGKGNIKETAIQECVHVLYNVRWNSKNMIQKSLKQGLTSLYPESYMEAERSKMQHAWNEIWSDSFRDDRILSEYQECITDLTMVRMCLELGDYEAVKKEMDRIAGQLQNFEERQALIKKYPNRYIPSYKLNTDIFCTLLKIPLTQEKMLPSAEFVPYQRSPKALYEDLQRKARARQPGFDDFMLYGKKRSKLIKAVDAAIEQLAKIMDASKIPETPDFSS